MPEGCGTIIKRRAKAVRGIEYLERWLSWSKAHDWKSCNVSKAFEGSNPSLSATKNLVNLTDLRGFLLCLKALPVRCGGVKIAKNAEIVSVFSLFCAQVHFEK